MRWSGDLEDQAATGTIAAFASIRRAQIHHNPLRDAMIHAMQTFSTSKRTRFLEGLLLLLLLVLRILRGELSAVKRIGVRCGSSEIMAPQSCVTHTHALKLIWSETGGAKTVRSNLNLCAQLNTVLAVVASQLRCNICVSRSQLASTSKSTVCTCTLYRVRSLHGELYVYTVHAMRRPLQLCD
jgi:hypothetical protein